jgi:hypothetical protein
VRRLTMQIALILAGDFDHAASFGKNSPVARRKRLPETYPRFQRRIQHDLSPLSGPVCPEPTGEPA